MVGERKAEAADRRAKAAAWWLVSGAVGPGWLGGWLLLVLVGVGGWPPSATSSWVLSAASGMVALSGAPAVAAVGARLARAAAAVAALAGGMLLPALCCEPDSSASLSKELKTADEAVVGDATAAAVGDALDAAAGPDPGSGGWVQSAGWWRRWLAAWARPLSRSMRPAMAAEQAMLLALLLLALLSGWRHSCS